MSEDSPITLITGISHKDTTGFLKKLGETAKAIGAAFQPSEAAPLPNVGPMNTIAFWANPAASVGDIAKAVIQCRDAVESLPAKDKRPKLLMSISDSRFSGNALAIHEHPGISHNELAQLLFNHGSGLAVDMFERLPAGAIHRRHEFLRVLSPSRNSNRLNFPLPPSTNSHCRLPP